MAFTDTWQDEAKSMTARTCEEKRGPTMAATSDWRSCRTGGRREQAKVNRVPQYEAEEMKDSGSHLLHAAIHQ